MDGGDSSQACARCVQQADGLIDGWGHAIRARCSDGGFGVAASAGADNAFGTDDDIAIGFAAAYDASAAP